MTNELLAEVSILREKVEKYEKAIEDIKAEIDRQQKWLLQAGYTAYNVDIALDTIKSVVAGRER